jgi:transcriptional regulator with XRE-family HTH domain
MRCIFYAACFGTIGNMSDELTEAFGLTLRRHRKRKDWSQMKLAMDAGMHLNALGNLERGKRNPSLQTIVILCKALGVAVAQFMGEVEAESRKNTPAKKRAPKPPAKSA